MMALWAQQDACAALRSQLAAGISISDAAARLVRLQKTHAQFWSHASKQLRNGYPLSALLDGVWPQAAISAVRAGEDSGSLVEVLDNLERSVEIQRDIRSAVSEISYPIGILLGALVVMAVFVLGLAPFISQRLAEASGNYGELGGIAGFGLRMRELLAEHSILVAVCSIGGIAAFVQWVRSPTTLREVTRLAIAIPLIGPGINELCFGLWARYMVLSCRAGMPTVAALRSTIDVLPEPLRPGISALIHDLEVRNLPLNDASNPDTKPDTDPRQQWPFYVPHAFAIAERSGRLDTELERVAPELIKRGTANLKRGVTIANRFALGIAASILAAAMVLFYAPLMAGMSNLQ